MKILDIPQSGKQGLSVSQGGRFGQIRRQLVIPNNPNSAAQTTARAILGAQSRRWDSITQSQRDAWTAAAAQQMSNMRLGQNGPLTGNQLFVKVNVTLVTFGQEPVDVPPAVPEFPALAPTALVLTYNAGSPLVKLTCPTSPGDNTIVRAAAPCNVGIARRPDVAILGMCPAPAVGASDITALYTAKYGAPIVGKRIFVTCNLTVDGYESPWVTFTGIVPAA